MLGRYIRYQGHATQLVVVDPEHSVFYDYYHQRNPRLTSACGSRIEGIGRPRVEPSFIPDVIDRMIQVPDAASLAALTWLTRVLGRRAGASTGTNIYGALLLAAEMRARGEQGSIVTLLCDSGERYPDTYYNESWVNQHIGDTSPYLERLMSGFSGN